MTERFKELGKQYRETVVTQAKSIDPDSEHDWASIALGFALGRGYSLQHAIEFSEIAYQFEA